jgi:glycolate oxidase iron-sulfur subunit
MSANFQSQLVNLDQLSTASPFDQQHPPAADIIDKCVHCGFCLPSCPTYALWGEEMDSPRGRIYLMKMAREGAATMNAEWVGHFDKCLGCMACTTACPSGVDYGKLIEATRAQIERQHRRPFQERLFRRLIFAMFTNPSLLRRLRTPLSIYQNFGFQSAVRSSGVLTLLPKRLRAMEGLLPESKPRETVAEVTPAVGPRRARVGLLLGCVQREFFPNVNAATVRVLAAEGCEVVAPPDQPCCGALLIHAGEESPALDLARRTINIFERARVDVIISNAAGCGSNLKDYGHLLRDDPQYAERARRFSAKCRDILEFLAELEPRAQRHSVPLRIAYHDSCHLQHAQGVRSQPRQLLGQIPKLTITEIPESAICCGSAGIYNLVQPEPATALGDRKAALIAPLQVTAVTTANPGCLMQLQSALVRSGHPLPVIHAIQLLDASIRNHTLNLK